MFETFVYVFPQHIERNIMNCTRSLVVSCTYPAIHRSIVWRVKKNEKKNPRKMFVSFFERYFCIRRKHTMHDVSICVCLSIRIRKLVEENCMLLVAELAFTDAKNTIWPLVFIFSLVTHSQTSTRTHLVSSDSGLPHLSRNYVWVLVFDWMWNRQQGNAHDKQRKSIIKY